MGRKETIELLNAQIRDKKAELVELNTRIGGKETDSQNISQEIAILKGERLD